MRYAVGLAMLLAACSSATAPSGGNPCAANMAQAQAQYGPPTSTSNITATKARWGWTHPSSFTITFDWGTGTCVETTGL